MLRGVALTLDVRRLFACLDQPWRHVERGVVVLAAVATTSLTFCRSFTELQRTGGDGAWRPRAGFIADNGAAV